MAHAQKPEFVFLKKRTSPFKSAGASVQSTAGSRGARISGSNAGYTMFRGSVKVLGSASVSPLSRGQLKCDGTRPETRICLSEKWTSPFKSAGTSVQSTTGSRGARISGSNAGYTMFRGSVKGTGYPLHSPVSPSLPLPCVTACHHISTGVCHTNEDLCPSSIPCFVCLKKKQGSLFAQDDALHLATHDDRNVLLLDILQHHEKNIK